MEGSGNEAKTIAGEGIAPFFWDGEQPPPVLSHFDHIVLDAGVWQHLPWPHWALQYLADALLPQGRIWVSLPQAPQWQQLLYPLLKRGAVRLGLIHHWLVKAPIGLKVSLTESLTDVGFAILPLTEGPASQRGQEWMLGERLSQEVVHQRPFIVSERIVPQFERDYRPALEALRQWQQRYLSDKPNLVQPFSEVNKPKKPIVVLSPHPDDELIGCGGTLLSAVAAGQRVVVVQLTDGRHTRALANAKTEAEKTVRLEEAATVARRMGVTLHCLGVEDGQLAKNTQAAEVIDGILATEQPGCIFVPFMNDPHPDHVAANRMLYQALSHLPQLAQTSQVLSYAVWSLVPPQVYQVVDDQMAEKAACLKEYVTPMKVKDYVAYCRQLHAYHGRLLLQQSCYVEAFYALSGDAYQAFMAKMPELMKA